MKTKQEWATQCLKTIFRPDFEKLVEEIQNDALQKPLKDIKELKSKLKHYNRSLENFGKVDNSKGA